MSSRAPFTICCEVFIRNGNRILLGKRGKNVTGAGMWALPGGHLESEERLIDAVCREVKEELGAVITPNDLELVSIVDDLPDPGKDNHYIHATFELKSPAFEPKLMEPEECDEWRYFDLDALPHNDLFWGHKVIVDNYLKNRLYAK